MRRSLDTKNKSETISVHLHKSASLQFTYFFCGK